MDNALQFKLTTSSVDVAWENAVRNPDVQSHINEQRMKWSFIVQLSPWMGEFYERFVGISKKAIINSRPLVYLGQDLNDRTLLTPSHLLLPNTKTGIPLILNDDNVADPTYFPAKISSKETILNTWKKGQNLL